METSSRAAADRVIVRVAVELARIAEFCGDDEAVVRRLAYPLLGGAIRRRRVNQRNAARDGDAQDCGGLGGVGGAEQRAAEREWRDDDARRLQLRVTLTTPSQSRNSNAV